MTAEKFQELLAEIEANPDLNLYVDLDLTFVQLCILNGVDGPEFPQEPESFYEPS